MYKLHRLLRKRLAGGGWDLPVTLGELIVMGYLLVLLMTTGATLLMSFMAVVSATQSAQAAALDQQMIDPATGQPIAYELVQRFSQFLPVTNAGNAVVSTPPTKDQAGAKQLYVSLISNQGYVTLTLDYGLQIPLDIPMWNGTSWTTAQTPFIPLYFSVAFFQEW